jgi:hypothetical protein
MQPACLVGNISDGCCLEIIDGGLAAMMPSILNSSSAASYAAQFTKGKCDIFNFEARS